MFKHVCSSFRQDRARLAGNRNAEHSTVTFLAFLKLLSSVMQQHWIWKSRQGLQNLSIKVIIAGLTVQISKIRC